MPLSLGCSVTTSWGLSSRRSRGSVSDRAGCRTAADPPRPHADRWAAPLEPLMGWCAAGETWGKVRRCWYRKSRFTVDECLEEYEQFNTDRLRRQINRFCEIMKMSAWSITWQQQKDKASTWQTKVLDKYFWSSTCWLTTCQWKQGVPWLGWRITQDARKS